ncbi:hypothetical protein [Halorussus halobius]|uniref:hypothetical protein n=1 Tax=Halorussus halobius TaxID=1710537 RepID=UPI0010919AB2|nr:hypothetical protein [Halorussus halobius]
MSRREAVRLGLALAVGVVVPGLANYALASAGYETLGTVAWFGGYLVAMLGVWYVWVRPLDLRAATG